MNKTQQEFWKPGSIVKLKKPFKPGIPDRSLMDAIVPNATPQYKAYKAWKGFTHGIIVQIIGHEQSDDDVSNVSLHLYDPERHVIYIEDYGHGIPTYVDFHVDELTPWKDGSTTGYDPVK